MAKATMQDIADALNTSRITVWKALNNRPGVSAALRAEIQRKAQELGYTKGGTPAAAAVQPAAPAGTRTRVGGGQPAGKLAVLDADRPPPGAGAGPCRAGT